MRIGARQRARPLADRLAALFPQTRTVLDVGGGPATQALAFQELGWQVSVLDFPEVIDLMAADLESAGIATIKGDATQGIPARGFDLIFCGNLFHAMSPRGMRDGGGRAPPGHSRPAAPWPSSTSCAAAACPRRSSPSTCSSATSAGDVYAEDDYRSWCEAAGLQDFAVHEVAGQSQCLLTAEKP